MRFYSVYRWSCWPLLVFRRDWFQANKSQPTCDYMGLVTSCSFLYSYAIGCCIFQFFFTFLSRISCFKADRRLFSSQILALARLRALQNAETTDLVLLNFRSCTYVAARWQFKSIILTSFARIMDVDPDHEGQRRGKHRREGSPDKTRSAVRTHGRIIQIRKPRL